MPVRIVHTASPGGTFSVTLERFTSGGASNFFKPSAGQFVDPSGLSYLDKRTLMVEGNAGGGPAENAGSYIANISNVNGASGTFAPGLIIARVHDESASNRTVAQFEGFAINNEWVRLDQLVSSRTTIEEIAAQLSTTILNTSTGVLLPELTEVPPAVPTIGQAVMLLYMAARNRSTSTGTLYRIYNGADSAVMEGAVTDDSVTTVRGRLQSVAT